MFGIFGKYFIQFMVDTPGDISNARVVRGIHPLLDKGAYKPAGPFSKMILLFKNINQLQTDKQNVIQPSLFIGINTMVFMNLFGNYKFNNIIMKSIMFFLIVNLFAISVKSQVIKGSFKEGEVYLTLNEINHWVKIKGLENKTMPIIILHGGPWGNNYVFERTIGPLLEEFATIVYYEQRGCGRSYAAKDTNDYVMLTLINDLDELIKTLGVETQCLIITGIHDKNGGFHSGKCLDQILPNSELKLYRNSAHFPDLEETEKFASDVKSFIVSK